MASNKNGKPDAERETKETDEAYHVWKIWKKEFVAIGLSGILATSEGIFGVWGRVFGKAETETGVYTPLIVEGLVFLGAVAVSMYRIAKQALRDRKKADALEKKITVHERIHQAIHDVRDELHSVEFKAAFPKMPKEERQKKAFAVIQTVVGYAKEGMDAMSQKNSRVCVKMLQQEEGVFTSLCYSASVPQERKAKTTAIPIDEGLANQVRKSGAIRFTNDVLREASFFPTEQRESIAKRYRTVVACPINLNGQLCGLLCIDWAEPDCFSEDMLQPLACFTDTISIVVHICGTPGKKHRIGETRHEPTEQADSTKRDTSLQV